MSGLLASYFGSEVLTQIALAANTATSVFVAASAASALSAAPFSGASTLANGLGVAAKAKQVFRFLQNRNAYAYFGRRVARAYPRADASAIRAYGNFTGGAYSQLPELNGYQYYAQAHHINQNAAFEPLGIARKDGAAIPLAGTKNQPGTPHYEFHYSLDTFWDLYRIRNGVRGPLYNQFPTLAQYDQAVRVALRHAGYSKGVADEIADVAKRDWSHLSPNTKFFNIPKPTVSADHTLSGADVSFYS